MDKIRYESNLVDKVFLKKTFEEIENAITRMKGLNDINAYRREFEENFARYIGNKFAFAVNSGTDALHLALLLLGIGKGDTVIVSDLCYVSTAFAVSFVGAIPVFVDAQPNLSINTDLIEENITGNTKAIIAVHMFGQPCNMNAILKIAKEHNLHVIEDCCQAFGTKYNGKNVGTFGDIAAFSFSYYKPMSSMGGNGGIITFNKENYAELIGNYLDLWEGSRKLLLNKKFSKMSLIDIAAVKVKMRYKDVIISQRTKLKEIYEKKLKSLKTVKIFPDEQNVFSVKESYNILADNAKDLIKYLEDNNVLIDKPYPPLHKMDAFRDLGYKDEEFKISNLYYEKGVHLPLFSFMKKGEVRCITELIKEFYK